MRLEARNGELTRHALDTPDAVAVFRPAGRFDFGSPAASYRVLHGPDRRITGLE